MKTKIKVTKILENEPKIYYLDAYIKSKLIDPTDSRHARLSTFVSRLTGVLVDKEIISMQEALSWLGESILCDGIEKVDE